MLIINQQRIEQLTLEQIANYQQRFPNILDSELPSITQNTSDIKQKSGANNYASLAPYYHPNPDTETGFPYIRRDGVRNPIAVETSDSRYLGKLFQIVIPCSLLYYLTHSEDYSLKAIAAINKFFNGLISAKFENTCIGRIFILKLKCCLSFKILAASQFFHFGKCC